ncbi:LOW QUALITY PROTEIN: Ergochrome gene cluster protein, partial [Frankliniella fusca]
TDQRRRNRLHTTKEIAKRVRNVQSSIGGGRESRSRSTSSTSSRPPNPRNKKSLTFYHSTHGDSDCFESNPSKSFADGGDQGDNSMDPAPIFSEMKRSEREGFASKEVESLFILEFLSGWARRGVSFHKIDELLACLGEVFPSLPKSRKTLLKTPRRTVVTEIGGGVMWYKGLSANFNERLSGEYLAVHKEIIFDLNMDGLELYDSYRDSFWPILGCLKDQQTPFIIGCFYGEGKPDSVDEYLADFVTEMKELKRSGFEIFGSVYPVKTRNFILDAPAKSFVKCTGHTAKTACEKCDYNRIVFDGVEGELRTDESFTERVQPLHPKGMSPLERDLGIKMVSAFRLDAMHLVHGGSFKRWVLYLVVICIAKNPQKRFICEREIGL